MAADPEAARWAAVEATDLAPAARREAWVEVNLVARLAPREEVLATRVVPAAALAVAAVKMVALEVR